MGNVERAPSSVGPVYSFVNRGASTNDCNDQNLPLGRRQAYIELLAVTSTFGLVATSPEGRR